MARKILIINSSPEKNRLLKRAFKELAAKGWGFSLFTSTEPLGEEFRRENWPAQKIRLGPEAAGRAWLFLAAGWLVWLELFSRLIGVKINRQADTIVCLDINEKILASLPARLLNFRLVWLENPELDYGRMNKFFFWLYRLNSRLAKVAVFNSFAQAQLASLSGRQKNIVLIRPGAKLANYQANIFDKLAGQNDYRRKYFTVGAITDLNQRQKIETVFQAAKTALSVIPNLQLIVVGEGRERKNLLWSANKMGIENLVWLVGEQEQIKKWLDSFDVFLAVGDRLKLDDFGNILEAMAAGLPVLAPRHTGAEDLIKENKTGALIETNNAEMLARQIIKLHQDKKLRLSLGKNGCERVAGSFTLESMADQLERLL